jgi:Leucine-rich repeat (LRR) protein
LLPKLQYLRLGYNQDLLGYFPEFYSNSSLKILGVRGTRFFGKLPTSIGNLESLNELWIGSSNFSGHIPPSLGNLTQLTILSLQFNKLECPIPFSIFELEKLEYLNLYSNNLGGIVSIDMFQKFKYLTLFFLSINNISFLTKSNTNVTQNKFEILGLASCNMRHFPDFLRNQDQLKYLDLSYNNIHGQIPKWLWNTSKDTLMLVNFSHNFLTGFDQHLVNFPWPHLHILDLRSNKLQSLPPIPPPLTVIYLVADNMLQGEISPLICTLSSLYSLDLSNNKFRGILPHCFGNFNNSMSILNLRGNNFHGMIPQLCAKGSRMKMIDLSQNQFKGVLPRSLSNCKMIEIINLGRNQLNEVFPTWLGTLPELRVLILRQNGFYGVVGSPTTIFASPKLRIIDLSANKFTGKLPFECFRNWKRMRKDNANDFTFMKTFTSFPTGDIYTITDYLYSMTIINKGKETIYPKIIKPLQLLIFQATNSMEGFQN